MLFKIGDFSRLSQVSIKALRIYDDMKLLKPAYVDDQSGYRYYSAEQLEKLNKIIALKHMGFSLEQISMLIQGLEVSGLREMLIVRKSQIEQQISLEYQRLQQVEARIRQIEEGHIMSNYNIVTKQIPSQKVVCKRAIIPSYAHVGELFHTVCGAVVNTNNKFNGPAIAMYHDHGYKEQDVDVEVAVPVNLTGDTLEGLEVKVLPAVDETACIVHKGSYETLSISYGAIMNWIAENHYEIMGPARDVYLLPIDQCQDPAECVTEIQFPVRKTL
ncbi:MAG: MerR family transcriptional regulator [Bacillota bacterium]|nr:MerR family transcriptional regulator [Bacillota bacterium]